MTTVTPFQPTPSSPPPPRLEPPARGSPLDCFADYLTHFGFHAVVVSVTNAGQSKIGSSGDAQCLRVVEQMLKIGGCVLSLGPESGATLSAIWGDRRLVCYQRKDPFQDVLVQIAALEIGSAQRKSTPRLMRRMIARILDNPI